MAEVADAADLKSANHVGSNPAARTIDMLRLRKELDPDAPDAVVVDQTRLIEWEPLASNSFNPEFGGYTAAPYCTGSPELGWCLYSRGAGACWNQRTHALQIPHQQGKY